MNSALRFRHTLFVLAAMTAVGSARSHAIEFDFKDPKGVNAMTFYVDSTLEPIVGLATGVSGTIDFDAANVEKTKGTIVVATKSVETSNGRMTGVLHSEDWLDVKKFDTIQFAIKNVTVNSKPGKGEYDLTMTGDFTCHGITKELNLPVDAAFLPNELGNRMGGKKGDLLIFRTEFTISRKAFGIKKDAPSAVVGDEIDIRLGIVGTHMD